MISSSFAEYFSPDIQFMDKISPDEMCNDLSKLFEYKNMKVINANKYMIKRHLNDPNNWRFYQLVFLTSELWKKAILSWASVALSAMILQLVSKISAILMLIGTLMAKTFKNNGSNLKILGRIIVFYCIFGSIKRNRLILPQNVISKNFPFLLDVISFSV